MPLFASGHVLESFGKTLETIICGGVYFLAFVGLTILSSFNLSKPNATLRTICIIILSLLTFIFLILFLLAIKEALKQGGDFSFMVVVGTGFSISMIALNIFFILRSYKNMKKRKILDNYFNSRF
jgi:hypothetical protein